MKKYCDSAGSKRFQNRVGSEDRKPGITMPRIIIIIILRIVTREVEIRNLSIFGIKELIDLLFIDANTYSGVIMRKSLPTRDRSRVIRMRTIALTTMKIEMGSIFLRERFRIITMFERNQPTNTPDRIPKANQVL